MSEDKNNPAFEPTYPPPPPSVPPALKSQLDREVQRQITEQTENFNRSYTPAADHAELKSDVKSLWRYVAALLTIMGLSAAIYMHIDGKITALNESINSESKYIFDKYENLENRVASDYRAMNERLDSVIMLQHQKNETSIKKPISEN